MRVAAIQHDIAWCDRRANFTHLAPMVATAAFAGARLILLTETFSTGFATERDDLGEPEGGPSSQFLAEQAAQHRDVEDREAAADVICETITVAQALPRDADLLRLRRRADGFQLPDDFAR